MRLWKVWFCLLAMIMVPVSAPALPLIDIEAAIGVWYTSPSGTLAYEPRPGFADDFLDIENDLAFDDEAKYFGRLKVDMPLMIPNIYLMVNPMNFEETNSGITFNFGGIPFNTDTFTSELDMNQYDIGLYYMVPLLKTASLYSLNVEGGINVRIIDAEATISQGAIKSSESETFALPMLYLGAQFRPIDSLSFEGEARGITYKDDKIYSLIGRVRYNAFGPWFVAGGYRYDDYDVDYDDFIIDMELSGPFVETGLHF